MSLQNAYIDKIRWLCCFAKLSMDILLKSETIKLLWNMFETSTSFSRKHAARILLLTMECVTS